MIRNVLILTMLFSLIACSEKTEQKADDKAQVKSVNTVVDPKKQKLESLKAMPSMNLEELKALLPAEFNNVKRTNLSLSSSLGYGSANADYTRNKTNYWIKYYDCAGEAGANIFESMYLNRLNQQKEDDISLIRTIDFMGGKAIEKIEKDSKIHTLTFLANERILVVISAKDVELETLREASKTLPLKVS